jgi:hypothetical protein
MRGITIEQILFLLLVLFLPMIEAVLKRRRQRGRGQRDEREREREEEREREGEEEEERVEADGPLVYTPREEPREGEISFEGVSAEGRSYDDEAEVLPAPAPALPPPRPRRVPDPIVVRAPAPPWQRPVYVPRSAARSAARVMTPMPAALPPGRRAKKRRGARITTSEARRGIVLMEVLGPCVALRDNQNAASSS